MLKPNLSLVEKYNKPGPRYTSYPTSPQFSEEIDVGLLKQDIQNGTEPLSLYFHIPFCESMCWFCGCTKIISKKRDDADAYLDTIEQEILNYIPLMKEGREVQQLHFGGGTPNFLSPKQIDRFSDFLHNHFNFASDAEMSAELDPRRLSEAHIESFQKLGVNRVSFGMQDVQESTQKAVNRVQSDEENTNAITWAKQAGMNSLNIDLIYGLPYQTPESIRSTIHQILKYDPDRLAIFSYAHVPWISPAQKILESHQLPSPESKIQMLGVIIEELTSSGYQYIGMDHFAKTTDSLAIAQRNKTMQRNFQGYSTYRDLEIFAFGMSSISQTANTYRQNFKEIGEYTKAVREGGLPITKGYVLTPEDHIRRTTIMRLMCDLSLDFGQMSEMLEIDFSRYFFDEIQDLKSMEQDGLIRINDNGVLVTDQGTLFIRNIAMHFDDYIGKGNARHSKTV